MNVVGIIQARMGASRLPGKVLMDIEGQPMLARVYARAQRARTLGLLAVATTVDPSDDLVADFCAGRGYPCFRGSMHDVLDRYYQAAKFYAADVIVRITADCPVIDPLVVDETVKLVTNYQFDFACNRLPPPFTRTFPIGLDVEVCTFAALERAWKEAGQKFHREHVMPFLYEGVTFSRNTQHVSSDSYFVSPGVSSRNLRIAQLHTRPDHGSLRWTVDTPEDLDFIRQLYRRFDGRDDFSWQDVLELTQKEPDLMKINADIRHKTLTEIDERSTDN
ncbi:MAG: glycosyltransferase family protein [Chloroflexota bacterium]